MRLRILLGVAFCALTAASAPTPNLPATARPLTLRNCIDLALSQNLDLRIQHLTVQQSGAALASAYGVYSPNFTLGATHSYVTELGNYDYRKFNDYFPDNNAADNFNTDLKGKIPYGFSYDFTAGLTKDKTWTDFRANPEYALLFPGGIRYSNDHNAAVDITMRQHLLKDFWIDADQELVLARRADLKISQEALRLQVMTTLLAVEQAYYDLVAAREEIQVQEQSLALREQMVTNTQRRVQVGEAPPLEDAQAQTQRQNALSQLAAAREVQAADQNRLIGLLTDDVQSWLGNDIQPTDTLAATPVTVNRADCFQSALSRRPDLREARLAVEKTGAMVKFQRNQLFPSLDLVGDYGGQGSETHFGGPALGDAFSFRNPEYSYGVVLSFPLDNATARGNYRANQAAKQVAQLQLKKAEQQVLLQIADLVSRLDFRQSQIASSRQARVFAEAALEAETKKFQNGFSTSYLVLQYQETLTAARTAEIRAQVDYQQTLAQLAFADGTLLEKNHLNLEVK